jgi:hypothetical protein
MDEFVGGLMSIWDVTYGHAFGDAYDPAKA